MHIECNLEADIKESPQIDSIAAMYRLKIVPLPVLSTKPPYDCC